MFSKKLNSPVFAGVKYELLEGRFRLYRELGIFPELYFDSASAGKIKKEEIESLRSLFIHNKMMCTIHAPFWDLSLGSADEEIRKISISRIQSAINIAKTLDSKNVVFHSGYNQTAYLSSSKADWNSRFIESVSAIADLACALEVAISLENVYEPDPELLITTVESIGPKKLGLCFDAGHFNVFGKIPLEDWLRAVAPFLREIHVHSNFGANDDHLAVDDGNIDFEKIFRVLADKKASAIVTIENKSDDFLVSSVKILRSEKYFRILNNFRPQLG